MQKRGVFNDFPEMLYDYFSTVPVTITAVGSVDFVFFFGKRQYYLKVNFTFNTCHDRTMVNDRVYVEQKKTPPIEELLKPLDVVTKINIVFSSPSVYQIFQL